MSRAVKPAFSISSVKPEPPKSASNAARAPISVRVPTPTPSDPLQDRKKAAAAAVLKKTKSAVQEAKKIEERVNAPVTRAPAPQKPAAPIKVQQAPRVSVATPPAPVAPPAPRPPAQVTTVAQPTPAAPMFESSHVLRYSASIGRQVHAGDIQDALARAPADVKPLDPILTVFDQSGLEAEITCHGAFDPPEWPALAELSSGHVVLVLEHDARTVTLFDQRAEDGASAVPVEEFAPYFTGRVLRAFKPLAAIEGDHLEASTQGHWFWSQFAGFKKQIGEIVLGSFVANLLAVAVALFSLQVYDRVIPHQSTATLWVLALGVICAIALEGALKLARARLMDGSGRKLEMSVQSTLMDRLLGMRSDQRSGSASSLFNSMREFGSVREFFTSSTISTVADMPFVLLFLALIASISGPVVVIVLIGAAFMIVPGYFLQGRMQRLTKETQGASARAARLLQEVVFEADTIKTQRGETRILRLWNELNLLSSVKSSEQRKLSGLLTYWAQAVQQLTYVLAVVAGAYFVFTGDYTVGTIIATGILISRTLGPLTQLSTILARWSNVKTALDGLDMIADAPQDQDASRQFLRKSHITGAYEIRATQFKYGQDDTPALDLGKVDLKAGTVVSVLGANGSGKSTFLKLLSGLYAPNEGRLKLDGAEIGQIDPRDLRRAIGYLGQDVRLFAGSLRDNLMLDERARDDADLLGALDFAGLGAFVRGHAKGLDLEISDGGAGLSVGQRQSIGWARLWLQDPSICLLDEPTAAFDQGLETALIARLQGWLAGRTAVIATHRLPILALSSRVMVFHEGRVVVDGPRDDVLAHMQKQGATTSIGGV